MKTVFTFMRKLARLNLLAAILVMLAAPGVPAAGELPDTSRMNVLFLNFEDFNAASLACYGNPICKSPNLEFGRRSDIFMTKPATAQQAREAVAAYYACVSLVDAGVGRILDTLEEEGLADNTIVVFLGDHGFHLGEHGLWSKYTLFEQSRRAPLIVRVPGAPGNGQVCKQLVEFVDILPTLGELSGLDMPGNLEGTSFAPLLANPARPWKKAAFTETPTFAGKWRPS